MKLEEVFNQLRELEQENTALQAKLAPQEAPALPTRLPDGCDAVPLWDSWHPGGHTLFGWLVVDKVAPHGLKGFIAYSCPAYGSSVWAKQLELTVGKHDDDIERLMKELEAAERGRRLWKELFQTTDEERRMMQGHLWRERSKNQARIHNLLDSMEQLRAAQDDTP